MAHKIVSPKLYVVNICVLTVLMGATVVFAKNPAFHFSSNPNGINLAIALAIAIAKATCIVSIFMGVAFATKLVRAFAIGGFAWLLILFAFTLNDYVNADFGSPYHDFENLGTSPFPGGQDFPVSGNEVADGSYVVLDHSGGHEDEGHEEDAGDGEEGGH